MIVNFILYALYLVMLTVTVPLRFLDDAVLNPNITSSIAAVGTYFAIINRFAPLTTIFAIVVAFLSIEAAVFLWKMANWLIRKIPGIS